jgi:hypothetical protein
VISVKTASVQVSHILRKLAAPNRREAAAIATASRRRARVDPRRVYPVPRSSLVDERVELSGPLGGCVGGLRDR